MSVTPSARRLMANQNMRVVRAAVYFSGSTMKASATPAPATRPGSLTYGLEAVPPVTVIALSALQHVAIIGGISVIFPLLVLQHVNAPPAETARVLTASLMALGIATMLQAYRGRWLGAGFLAPAVFTAAYLPANIAAIEMGGLPLVAGMTIVAGLAEMVIAAALFRLRPFMPAEVAGFAVLMIGIVLGMIGFRLIIGVPESGGTAPAPLALYAMTGVVALAVMMAISTWGTPRLKLYGVLIGMAAGYALGLVVGNVDGRAVLAGLASAPRMPALPGAWPTFAPELLVTYLVGSMVCALRTLGDITTCQKINDPEWTRPDMTTIRSGVVADGMGTAIAGLVGAVGLNTFSGSIALSAATGVTSRVVGYATGALCIVIAFLPGAASAVMGLPPPVMGATLVFSGSFVVFNGIQIITARMLDGRKIIVIGTSLILGISGFADPEIYTRLPVWMHPVTSYPFTLAIVSALLLNAVFRIGIRRSASKEVQPGAPGEIVDFLAAQGAAWGARRDVIQRATAALVEFVEHLRSHAPDQAATLSLRFDETSLVAEVAYNGTPLVLTEAAATTPAGENRDELEGIGARIIAGLADRARATTRGDRQLLQLTFVH